jgi:hypothetical protein
MSVRKCASPKCFLLPWGLQHAIHFSGRRPIVVQNSEVLKSGYEEEHFCRRKDRPLLS